MDEKRKFVDKPSFWIVVVLNLLVIGMLVSFVFDQFDRLYDELRLLRADHSVMREDVSEEIEILKREVAFLRSELGVVYELDDKLNDLLDDSLDVRDYILEYGKNDIDYEDVIVQAFWIVLAKDRHFDGSDELMWFFVSLLKEESHFDPTANSGVARGPAQMTDGTFEAMGYCREDIWVLGLNIDAGAMYVRKLVDRFEGDLVLVTAGYNAGPTAVSSWLSSGVWDGAYCSLENVPYREARNHVKKVFGNAIVDQSFVQSR